MHKEHAQQVLYDLALSIAGEPELLCLQRNFLQRLLYHTGFPCALLLHRLSETDEPVQRIEIAIGDRQLRLQQGNNLNWPEPDGGNAWLKAPYLPESLLELHQKYPFALRLVAGESLQIYLLTHRQPEQADLLLTLFEPVLLRFAKAHQLCAQAHKTALRLQRAKEEAEQANQAKSVFLSSMSHELRTPLNAILGFAQLLEYDEELNADQLDNLHEIYKAGKHLLSLINEILDLAKIEAGRIELLLQSLSLAELANESLSLVSSLAAARQVVLHHDLSPELVVWADSLRLKQVLLNLLSNAIKYNRTGGEVRLHAVQMSETMVRILVEDTGPGIEQADQALLFKAFHRLNAEHSEVEGTGIGLNITRELVQLMGGEMGVESEPGRGSTFWFELPIQPAVHVVHDDVQTEADIGPSIEVF